MAKLLPDHLMFVIVVCEVPIPFTRSSFISLVGFVWNIFIGGLASRIGEILSEIQFTFKRVEK
jgi:hypothetical protein